MKRIEILILFFIIPILSFSQENEEGEIYIIFLKNCIERQIDSSRITLASYNGFEWKGIEKIIIIDSTCTYKTSYKFLKKELIDIQRSTFKDFKTKNKRPIKIIKPTSIDNIFTISQSNLEKIFIENEDGWTIFHEIYPNSQGILRIGLNKENNQGLLYVGNQSHWLSGLGYYILFEKVNGIWKEKSIKIVWIS